MKNSKLRRLLAVFVAFAIMLTTCGLGTFVFAADPDLVVNDGTDTTTVTADASYTVTSEDNAVTNGKAFNFTKNDNAIGAKEVTIAVSNAKLSNVTAISMYVEIPEIENNGTVDFVLGIEAPGFVFQGDWYVISNNGALIGKNLSTLKSGFKGEIVYLMPSNSKNLVKASKKVTVKVDGSNETFQKNEVITLTDFIDYFRKITKLGFTLTNSADIKDKSIVVDEIKYHFETKDEILNEYNLKIAPPVLPSSGRVATGLEIEISAAAGAEIYYTLDGTAPSTTNGIKYSEQKPVINENCTLKAIAITESGRSLIAEASYYLFPANYPNFTVLNDAAQDKIYQDTGKEGVNAKTEKIENSSPYGTAVKYTGLSASGTSVWNVENLSTVPSDDLADYSAIGMWVSAPYGFYANFPLSFNNTSTKFIGDIITYNTLTGETKEYKTDLSKSSYAADKTNIYNFEGYIFFLLKGTSVKNGTTNTTWKSFLKSNELDVLKFNLSHATYNTFVADNFVAIVQFDKYLEDIKANTAKHPKLPSAKTSSGAVLEGDKIELISNEGSEIYYTLDGTTPTTASTKYDAANPPAITADTTLKAVAVLNGITTDVVEYNYTILQQTDEDKKPVIINGFEDVATVTPASAYDRVVVSGVGYFDNAISLTGIKSGSGATMINIKNEAQISKEQIMNKKALAFWVSVSANDSFSFNPCINGEMTPLKTTCTTYNTATGEIKNYEKGDIPVLSGFHGFIILDLDGECVRASYDNNGYYYTWRNYIAKSGFNAIQFYRVNTGDYNKTYVMDHMVFLADKEDFIETVLKALPKKPLAPSADIPGGIVKQDEEITFIAQGGAEVYYTVDGTEPTKESIKYDPENKPKITEATTIKAIAYIGDEESPVIVYDYTLIDPNLPNVAVINDADDLGTITNWEGYNGSTSRRQVEGISPFGKALEITGTNSANKGSLLNVKNLDTTIDINTLPVKEGIAYWINVPIGKDISFIPNINDEQYALKCEKITYNATTGELKEYGVDEKVVLNGFEGYIILKLEGSCIRYGYAKTDEDGNDITPYKTWRQFVSSHGFSQFVFYMNDSQFFNKTFTVDHFVMITDIDKFIEEEAKVLDSRPMAPTSEIDGGIVASGEKISFNSLEDAAIYYTTNGTTPDKNSTKYDAANPPVITESPTTIKAVVYDESKDIDYSLVTEYKFEFLGADVPNSTVINDVVIDADGDGVIDEDVETKTVLQMTTYGERTNRVYGDEISMFGSAVTITGMNPVNTGSLMGFANLDTTLSVDQLAAHGAMAFWVSIPSGTTMNLTPKFNGEQYNIKAQVIAYNTSNGEITEYKPGENLGLDGFEGFLIYKLEGDCVRTTWSESSYVTWRKFVKSNGLKNITFYYNDKSIYNKTFTLDRFTMVVDVDKFIEELKTLPKRPLPPTADPGSDAVAENTQIFLHTEVGNRIVYTLDGTIPAIDAEGNITNGTLYTTYSMGNGQEDASYIELREATTVKAIAINLDNNISGVVTFNYTIEPPYSGPNVVMLNNGTGEGNNTWSYLYDQVFNAEIVDNNSPDGKGIKATIIDPTQKSTVQEIGFKLETEGVEQIHNAQGFSFHITVSDLGKASNKMGFGPRVSGNSNYLNVNTYAISDDGETVLKNVTSFNDFSGTVYCVIQHPASVSMSYGSKDIEWKKFIKNNGLTNFGFYYTCSKKDETTDPDAEYWFEMDDISLIYDTEQLFKDINLDGLLATYDAGTFENTNMIVTNDGSGNAKNVGLAGFTEGLVIEKTNHSFDERNLKLTMPKGESFINFMSTSEEEELVIADGTAFWVEMPKGAGDTELGLQIYDTSSAARELFEYSDRWYYLIDKQGTISKREGAMIIPDGFRGWVVVPKANMFLMEEEGFSIDNASLDFNQASNVIVTFRNKKNELAGKTVHIDDISFYAYFDKLVQSRAVKWEGQVFE